MKKFNIVSFAICFIVSGLFSCKLASRDPGSNQPVTGHEGTGSVKDSVALMAAAISGDISRDGPVAWMRYFYDTPSFFMASDGQLAFPDHQTAGKFINEVLVRQIRQIHLEWKNLRIDSLNPVTGVMASDFHEDITDSTGKTIPVDGYFTGIAQQTPAGWQLRDAHWSIKHNGK